MKSKIFLFEIGKMVVTPAALEVLKQVDVEPEVLATEHMAGLWGDIGAEEQARNDHAVQNGGRIWSAHKVGAGRTVWVITEADRSVTTLLLPEER